LDEMQHLVLLLSALLPMVIGVSFDSKRTDVFNVDFEHGDDIVSTWILSNGTAVMEYSEEPETTPSTPAPTEPPANNGTTNGTDVKERIVNNPPIKALATTADSGKLQIPLAMPDPKEKANMELHTNANVRGYDLSPKDYDSSKLPTFDIYLMDSKNVKTDIFKFSEWGLNFQAGVWTDFRVSVETSAGGNYTLVYDFSGSANPSVKGVLIKHIHLSRNPAPKTNDQIKQDYDDGHPTTTEPPGPPDGTTTNSASTSVIVLAVLVVILILCLLALGYKYHRTSKKLNEYRVSTSGASRPYDNPVYNSGTHTPAERMGSTRGSVS